MWSSSTTSLIERRFPSQPLHLRLVASLVRFLNLVCLLLVLPVAGNGQAGDAVVATIDGKPITLRELDDSIIRQVLPLHEQLFALRKVALENLVIRKVLESEARKRGITVGELRRALTAGPVAVTPEEVENAYAENEQFLAAMSPDEAKERLRLDLENHARLKQFRTTVAGLRQGMRIESLLQEPKLTVEENPAAPSRGLPTARITIVEFSDYECPYCRSVQSDLKQLLELFGKDVRLIFRHLPLEIHENALLAAQASYCADKQGKFWILHDALFATPTLNAEAIEKLAAAAGVERLAFQRCLQSPATREAIQKDVREATRLGLNSTPTFLINGRIIRGAASLQDFKATIERELRASAEVTRAN